MFTLQFTYQLTIADYHEQTLCGTNGTDIDDTPAIETSAQLSTWATYYQLTITQGLPYALTIVTSPKAVTDNVNPLGEPVIQVKPYDYSVIWVMSVLWVKGNKLK